MQANKVVTDGLNLVIVGKGLIFSEDVDKHPKTNEVEAVKWAMLKSKLLVNAKQQLFSL